MVFVASTVGLARGFVLAALLLPLLATCTPKALTDSLSNKSSSQLWTGTASVYSRKFEGRLTTSGATFRHRKLTGAHKSLPMGTRVKVTNLKLQCSVEVLINDRLPAASPHLIDLSRTAAKQIALPVDGIGKVRVEVVSLP